MSVYLIQESSLTDIADSIRAKTGETDKMTVSEKPEKIDSISSDGRI